MTKKQLQQKQLQQKQLQQNNVTPSERWGPDGVTKLGLAIAEKRFKKRNL